MKKFHLFSVLATFVFCYLCWIVFTLSFSAQELTLGAMISLMVALFTARFLIHEKPLYFFNPKRFFALMHYFLFVFTKELWNANLDVAKRALNPKLPIKPGIVRVPTELKSEYGLAMLANSITLKPGTITMDIVEENGKNCFYVHCINVTATKGKEAGDAVKGILEKRIRRIFK
ncbi:MAG: sodium:proton antiporter [Clostridiales bacterium]|nr:sodium:proton antiporter [Clostridiales bacterium]